MPVWWPRRRERAPEDARRRQVIGQARAVLEQLRRDGQPERHLRALAPFVELAPEVLALGPLPAWLTTRVLFGLCTFEGEARQRFLATVAEELATPSPTLRAALRGGLLERDEQGLPRATPAGWDLYRRLERAGAFREGPLP